MPYTIDDLAQQQRDLVLDRFDLDIAWQLGLAIREASALRNAPVVVTVTHGTDLVFTSLLPGGTPDNLAWAARKRAVVHRFQRSSLAMRLEAEKGGYDLNKVFRLPEADFVASGGGVPLMLTNGLMVGIAAVSGLPDVEDHDLIVEALRKLART